MIKPPSFKQNAIPSLRGWRHPRTGELLKKVKLTQEQIDEYLGVTIVEPDIDIIPIVEVEEEIDWEVEEIDLDSMTKTQLIETAEEWDVFVDTKATKSEIKAILEKELF